MQPTPKKLSSGEELFVLHCRAYKLEPVREYVFALPRKWRFDFAWPDLKLAVEIDGGTSFGKGRHSRGTGFENDCRKLNHAAMLGWRVMRFSTAMIVSGEGIDAVRETIKNTLTFYPLSANLRT